MSQNVTHQTTLDRSAPDEPSPSPVEEAVGQSTHLGYQGFVVDSADRLMNELFEDVERVLRDGAKLPTEPVAPEPSALSLAGGHLTSLLTARSSAELEAPETAAIALDDSLDDDELGDLALTHPEHDLAPITVEAPRHGLSTSIDKLLLALACTSLVVTGVIWLVLQGRWPLQTASVVATAPTATTEPEVSAADREFLDYVQRSLDVIDDKAEISRQTATAAQNGLPPVAVAGSPSTPATLERVYIPVYQPPQMTGVTPSQPSSGGAQAPTALPTVPVTPSQVAAAPLPAPTPVVTHQLIGVLELGDRSAALFSFNGATQRVQVGESIGSSGWTLVSVNGSEAVIRRNGEVRSVYIQQQF